MDSDEHSTEPGSVNEHEQDVDGVPQVWSRIADAPHITLLLDYDGTLAPFHEDRNAAVPLPGIVDILSRIDQDPAIDVAVVSGRPVTEIQRLLGTDRLTIAGTHGFELYRPDDGMSTLPISDEQRAALDAAEQDGVEAAGRERTERKVATVAVHVRGLDDQEAAAIAHQLEVAWTAHLGNAGLEIRHFDGGIEIRALGRNKGDAVREMARNSPSGSFVLYIGDDETDEDAFRALPANGVGIKVGPPEAPTGAQGRLPSCEAVRRFLWTLMEIREDG